MFQLVKIEEDEQSYELLYEFQKNLNPDWKKLYIVNSIFCGRSPLSQGNLSDYEFFKRTQLESSRKSELSSTEFFLLAGRRPITSIYVIMLNDNIADITMVTLPNERNKGYAKIAVSMIENILFQNPQIAFTSITDISDAKISTQVALSLGYVYEETTKTFVKPNPNLSLEQVQDMAKLLP